MTAHDLCAALFTQYSSGTNYHSLLGGCPGQKPAGCTRAFGRFNCSPSYSAVPSPRIPSRSAPPTLPDLSPTFAFRRDIVLVLALSRTTSTVSDTLRAGLCASYMCLRSHTFGRIRLHCLASRTYIAPRRCLTQHCQSQPRFTPQLYHSPSRRRISHCGGLDKHTFKVKHSGSGLWTAAIVFGIGICGVIVFPFFTKTAAEESTTKEDSSWTFDYSNLTDSYLVMVPNTPPGRPGTVTPEEEAKLRELWAATLKVFGVYEAPLAPEPNGTAAPVAQPTSEVTEKEAKKDKKKSKLSVFKRNKGEKETHADSATPSGTATPLDISTLSIADEDDKHGQTKDFKAALANNSPEDLRKAFWSMLKHDHPDGLLLRFLRARKWDVEKALVMMISAMHWRFEQMHVDDDIILHGELGALEQSKSDNAKVKKEGEDFLMQLRMGKSYLHGLDKEGRPITIVRARLHRQGEQSEESLERFTVYTIETARLLLRPPVDTATIVFDMTGFSMSNMDYAPVKFMIKCFEANYPESLGAVLVYKAPWIFNTIWSIIRGWLDPVVAGKVHFAKDIKELEAYVARADIPAELGGDEKWEYSYVEPTPGENDLSKDATARDAIVASRGELVKRYESTILEWIHAGDAQGKTSEERRTERNTIAEELRNNYWKLDPYVRARTLYDRTGLIGLEGKLNFSSAEQKAAVPAAPAQPVSTAPVTSSDDLD